MPRRVLIFHPLPGVENRVGGELGGDLVSIEMEPAITFIVHIITIIISYPERGHVI